jgi:hypothetical protein
MTGVIERFGVLGIHRRPGHPIWMMTISWLWPPKERASLVGQDQHLLALGEQHPIRPPRRVSRGDRGRCVGPGSVVSVA